MTPATIGPYVVERELGAGRMGTVYLARRPGTAARLAVKVLAPDLLDATDVLRFQREVEVLAAAPAHPSLVRVHAAGSERGRAWYAMELVEGRDLQALLGERGPVEPRAAARWVREVAGAVATLHGVGIVHRDIKPANIIVDPTGRARLADFGLARQLADGAGRLTRTGEVLGTPQFMAPEQALGLPVGPPADVYALGMVLYTLLAGSPAVAGASVLTVLQQVAQGELRPLREAAPGAPPALADLIGQALAQDPARRPPVAALGAALDAYLAGGAPGAGAGAAGGRRALAALALTLALAGAAALALAGRPAGPGPAGPATAAEVAAVATRLADAGLAPAAAAALSSEAEARAAAGGPRAGALLLLAGEAALRAGDLARARALGARAALARADAAEARALALGLAALSPDAPLAALEEVTAALAPTLAARPGRDDVRAWALLAAARLPRRAARLLDLVGADGVPPAALVAARLAAGRVPEAAGAAAAAPAGALDPALRARVAWAVAGEALAAPGGAPLEALEAALAGVEALGEGAGLDVPERRAARDAAGRAVEALRPLPTTAVHAEIGRALRRHVALRLLERMAGGAPRPPLVATTIGEGVLELAPGVRGPGARRLAGRLLAVQPDDVNAWVFAHDVTFLAPADDPARREPLDPAVDLPRLDRAIALARDAGVDWGRLVVARAAYLVDLGDLPGLEAWAVEAERRYLAEDPGVVARVLEVLGDALARAPGRERDGVAVVRRAAALAPDLRLLRLKAAFHGLELAARDPAYAVEEGAAVEAEAAALLAAPGGDAFLRLRVALDLARRRAARDEVDAALAALAPALAAHPKAELAEAAALRIELLARRAPLDRAALVAAVDDLARRTAGDAYFQEEHLRRTGEPFSAEHGPRLRGFVRDRIPPLRAAAEAGDAARVLALARAFLTP